MRVVIAPDSFKGGPSAERIAMAMARGVRRAGGSAVVRPMADGGEGTAEIVVGPAAEHVAVDVVDAFGRPRRASYLRRDGLAVVDAARGSGYVKPEDRPDHGLRTTSRGTGMLIRAALSDPAVRRVMVALGGTGSTDGGLGLLVGLGGTIANAAGEPLDPVGDTMGLVASIRWPDLTKPVEALYDVAVPLSGPAGAVRSFGPQKGVPAARLAEAERALVGLARRVESDRGRSLADLPGAGAAGGMGFMLAALGAGLTAGADRVAEAVGLGAALSHADLCLTGEGRLDDQTRNGKVVDAVARRAAALGVPTIVLTGTLALEDPEWLYALGAFPFPILAAPMDLGAAVAATEALVEAAAARVVRLTRHLTGRCIAGEIAEDPEKGPARGQGPN